MQLLQLCLVICCDCCTSSQRNCLTSLGRLHQCVRVGPLRLQCRDAPHLPRTSLHHTEHPGHLQRGQIMALQLAKLRSVHRRLGTASQADLPSQGQTMALQLARLRSVRQRLGTASQDKAWATAMKLGWFPLANVKASAQARIPARDRTTARLAAKAKESVVRKCRFQIQQVTVLSNSCGQHRMWPCRQLHKHLRRVFRCCRRQRRQRLAVTCRSPAWRGLVKSWSKALDNSLSRSVGDLRRHGVWRCRGITRHGFEQTTSGFRACARC
mmetsp:Transcript_129130/g.248880  ORF Transcript_129130/g.248880 Transcript_129130/m.248880 type:complete len:269 (+) Transcript_129130:490-1296(+)